jgi:alpha-glucosidase
MQAMLAISSIAYAQETSTSSAEADGLSMSAVVTVSTGVTATGTSSTTQFTVPAAADEGPNLLPNIKDPNAKQAQALCPGYTASNVEHTMNGFTATLKLAGEAVSKYLQG